MTTDFGRATGSAPAPPPTAPVTRSCTRSTVRRCELDRVLHRVFRHRPDHGRRRSLPRRRLHQDGRRHDPPLPRAADDPGDGRLRPRLFSATSAHTCTGDGNAPWCCAPACRFAGHGIRAVPPDRHLRRGLPDHRGRARRGRLPTNANGERFMERYAPSVRDLASRDVVSRAMTMEIREAAASARSKDHIFLHRPSRPEDPARAPARHFGEREDFRRRRRDEGADPGAADRPLQHGRHPDELSRRGADQEGRRSDVWCRA